MKKLFLITLLFGFLVFTCKQEAKEAAPQDIEESSIEKTQEEKPAKEDTETFDKAVSSDDLVKVQPISHGTLVLQYDKMVIYVDPVGGFEAFSDYKKPILILVTDIHGDHLNAETIEAVKGDNTLIIAPKAVAEKLPADWESNISVLANGQSGNFGIGDIDITVEAVPMYNLREEALQFHTKYRGNGYVVTMNDQRIYISGDTEDIPEMRALENIDKAFVCMNLPYTMTVESAASAVLDFEPKIVYPYHYRGTEGLSDVGKFKELVNSGNPKIDVRLLNWYPNR